MGVNMGENKKKTEEKIKFFDTVISGNERKTLISLIKIDDEIPKLIKKPLSEIYRETKIKNEKRRDTGNDTHRGYQHRILNGLIKRGIVEKDKDKKYSIKNQFLDLAYSSLIQNKIKNLEKTGLFPYLDSTVFGIKNDWLEYPEMHHFHESLVNALSNLYMIKMVKKIFLLRDFAVKWKSFLDSDIPLPIKYAVWIKIQPRLSIFDQKNEDKFLERQIDVLKSMGMPEEKIEKCKKEINKQHKDFIIEFRKKIGYKPKEYEPKKRYKPELDEEIFKEIINKKLNKKQKKQVANVLDWCLDVYPKEIKNTGFFLDLGNLDDVLGDHFKIPVDNEEKMFRYTEDIHDFSRIESILKNIEKDTIDDSLRKLVDIKNWRNRSRFLDRFAYLFIKLIKRPFILAFYKQLDKKTKEEIISILREDKLYSKDKSDYELFYDYAMVYL